MGGTATWGWGCDTPSGGSGADSDCRGHSNGSHCRSCPSCHFHLLNDNFNSVCSHAQTDPSQYLPSWANVLGGKKVYTCKQCQVHNSNHDTLLSHVHCVHLWQFIKYPFYNRKWWDTTNAYAHEHHEHNMAFNKPMSH